MDFSAAAPWRAPAHSPELPAAAASLPIEVPPFELDEATVAGLQQQMASGARSAEQITEAYLGAHRGPRPAAAPSSAP